jgi:transposase InsO family protein
VKAELLRGFDGHRLDIRLKVVVRDPFRFEHEFEIERAWLLVIIDVCTRAVLGYHIALGREYSHYDVIKTIERTLKASGAKFYHRGPGIRAAGWLSVATSTGAGVCHLGMDEARQREGKPRERDVDGVV